MRRALYVLLFALLSIFFSSSLQAAATITGVVTSQSSGNPIPGATIVLIRGSQNIVATTTTAGDGSYTFAGVNPGHYSVRASATGFQTQIVGAKANNNQTTTINFQLLSNPGTISGQVVDAGTLSPISGATILVFQGNFLIASATSDLSGNYTVTGLDPGSYTLIALASGYQASVQGAIVQSGQTTVVNFSLSQRPGSVSGTVVASSSGLPIAGADVEILFENQVVGAAQTDGSGNYTISNLFPGSYIVAAQADGFQSATSAVNVQSNQTSIVNFSLTSPPGVLSGTVTDANTSLPIAGATVSVFSNNVLIADVLTDPSGNYTISDLPPGDYLVLANAPTYRLQIQPATILANQTTTLNFALDTTPSILQGKITNVLTGDPIPGAFVILFQNGSFAGLQVTDEEGNYIMSVLAPGNYTLTVIANGFYRTTTSFSIGAGEMKTLNVALMPDSPPRNLSGSVINNRFLLQADRIHHLQWEASQDPTVLYYQVFRNGVQIATISANAPLEYNDHNRSEKEADTYAVNAVDASGNTSSSAFITLR